MFPTTQRLPQRDGGIDLPEFASFVLLGDEGGIAALRSYYRRFMQFAGDHETGFIFESPTWRSSPDWGETLGYDMAGLIEANTRAIELMIELREEISPSTGPIIVSGCIGPRGDGYVVDTAMTADEAAECHRMRVDEATGSSPAYFMVNCAHPDHFADALDRSDPAIERIRGVRANASRMSHEELDCAEDLDYGNPDELAERYAELRRSFPKINVLGGCCGTDARHLSAIADACA